MAKRKILFTTLRLAPTFFWVEIWVGGTKKQLAQIFNERYGGDVAHYEGWLSPDQVADIESTEASECKGATKIVMNLSTFDRGIMVHECNHVLYHLAELCGLSTDNSSQEWTSYMLEYIYEHASKITNYQERI